jgi:hypothetical protein
MTQQVFDRLSYKGKGQFIQSIPFDPLDPWSMKGVERQRERFASGQEFAPDSTDNYKGYVASWQIDKDTLYLTYLRGRLRNGSEVSLGSLFPGENRVEASWFTGELCVIDERSLESQGRLEVSRIITVNKGKVVGSKLLDRVEWNRRLEEERSRMDSARANLERQYQQRQPQKRRDDPSS